MGVKYNGSDVQAIYYNGFTIAKMMHNGNTVWTPPVSGILIESRWVECVDAINNTGTAYNRFTHPSGYSAYSYGGELYFMDNEYRIGKGAQSNVNFFAMNIPDLAGKDYDFEVSLNNNFASSGEGAKILIQGINNNNFADAYNGADGVGVSLSCITSKTTYRWYPAKFGNTSMTQLTNSLNPLLEPYQAVETGPPGEYIYIQQRRGTNLYIKASSRASGQVILERNFENVPFNDLGTIILIQYDAAAYSKYIRNFSLLIYD